MDLGRHASASAPRRRARRRGRARVPHSTDDPPLGRGSGYVVDSLRSARMVLEAGSYEAVVKAAVALGDDTDTTAAIAGGIAGLRDGLAAIPSRWRDALRGRELLDPILAALRATA